LHRNKTKTFVLSYIAFFAYMQYLVHKATLAAQKSTQHVTCHNANYLSKIVNKKSHFSLSKLGEKVQFLPSSPESSTAQLSDSYVSSITDYSNKNGTLSFSRIGQALAYQYPPTFGPAVPQLHNSSQNNMPILSHSSA